MNFSAKPCYATSGIAHEVGSDLQTVLWEMINQRREAGAELDYLQIFELSSEYAVGDVFQKIVYSQEQPPFTQTLYYHNIHKPMNTKIWVIDDGTAVTMLFPEEY